MLIPMLYDQKREYHHEVLAKLAKNVDGGFLKPLLDDKEFTLEEGGSKAVFQPIDYMT